MGKVYNTKGSESRSRTSPPEVCSKYCVRVLCQGAVPGYYVRVLCQSYQGTYQGAKELFPGLCSQGVVSRCYLQDAI